VPRPCVPTFLQQLGYLPIVNCIKKSLYAHFTLHKPRGLIIRVTVAPDQGSFVSFTSADSRTLVMPLLKLRTADYSISVRSNLGHHLSLTLDAWRFTSPVHRSRHLNTIHYNTITIFPCSNAKRNETLRNLLWYSIHIKRVQSPEGCGMLSVNFPLRDVWAEDKSSYLPPKWLAKRQRRSKAEMVAEVASELARAPAQKEVLSLFNLSFHFFSI